jgi:hypothetical protein
MAFSQITLRTAGRTVTWLWVLGLEAAGVGHEQDLGSGARPGDRLGLHAGDGEGVVGDLLGEDVRRVARVGAGPVAGIREQQDAPAAARFPEKGGGLDEVAKQARLDHQEDVDLVQELLHGPQRRAAQQAAGTEEVLRQEGEPRSHPAAP